MKIQYFITALCVFLLFSCSDDKAKVPAYLRIDDISVTTSANQGTSSDKIIGAKVFINDQSQGFFELPLNVPILTTGKVNIKVRAGIFNNGISTDRDDYPFYTTYSVDTVLLPETELSLNPVVTYFPTININKAWAGENFESGINFEYHPDSDTNFVRVNDPTESFEGASGAAFLDEEDDFFEARTTNIVDVPRDGRGIYMEFNYKSTHNLLVSIYANGQSYQAPIVYLRPSAVYTKIYVELGPVFSTLSTAINYNLALGFEKPRGEKAQLYVDNFKLVSF